MVFKFEIPSSKIPVTTCMVCIYIDMISLELVLSIQPFYSPFSAPLLPLLPSRTILIGLLSILVHTTTFGVQSVFMYATGHGSQGQGLFE